MRANDLDLDAGPPTQNHLQESEEVIGKDDDHRAFQGDVESM